MNINHNKNNVKNKFFLLILFAFTFTTAYSQSNKLQKELSFNLVFGVYNDDQYNHTFDAKERSWVLKKDILIYKIDAYTVSYTDTLKLKETDIKTITKFVEENNLFSSIIKDLSKNYLDKYEHTESITGQLNYNYKLSNFNVKTNSSSSFDEDPDVNRLKKLENLLYQIIENYKN